MKKTMKKLITTIMIAVLIMPHIVTISYADDALETGGSLGSVWLVPEQQAAVALYTQKFVKEGNERKILLYSQNRKDRIKGYNLEVTSNEYGQFDGKQNNGAPFTDMLVYDSASFVATMYHMTLGMELSANSNARDNIYTVESFIKDAKQEDPFEKYTSMKDNNFGFIDGERDYSYQELIEMAEAGKIIPGDLIIYDDETHIMIYLGSGDEIIYEELIIEEAVVEDQTGDGAGVDGMDDEGVAEGPKITVPVGKDAHYFAHAYDANTNIEISALELLAYLEDPDSEYYVIRPKMTEANGITVKHKVNMDIVWPDSSYSAYTRLGIDPVTGKKQEYYYVGIPTTEEYFSRDEKSGSSYEFVGTTDAGEAKYEKKAETEWLIHDARDVISWFTGFTGKAFRGWAVWWTSQIEKVVSDTIQSVGSVQREISQSVEGNEYAVSKDNILNIEDIIYNRVPLFDANVFNTSTIAGVPIRNRKSDEELKALKERAELKGIEGVEAREELEEYYNSVLNTMSEVELKKMEEEAFAGNEDAMARLEEYRNQTNPILVIRQNVANMYMAIRNIAIVGLLLTLIYIGIRMAITTIAEQKAKYKQLLANWCVSLVIVFMIHYIMVFILQINDALVGMLPNLNGGISFYETFREMAFAGNFMEGLIGAIMYIVLLIFTIKYVWIYIKRFFTLCILTVAAPIIGIGYAIDKIKDNKSQSLSRWLRNYVFNVIIQFVHAALYTVLMSIVYNLLATGETFSAAILAFVFLNFITQSIKIVQNIFKVDANTLKNTLEDFGTQMAGVATIAGLVKTQAHLYGLALRPAKAVAGAALDEIKYPHADDVHSVDFDYLGDDDEIRKKFQEEEAIREKLEKQRKQKIKEDKARRRAHNQAQMQYAKNIMNMSKGLAYAAATMPTTVISPKAGIAMLVTAKNTYSKAKKDIKEEQSKILGYDVDKFKGSFSMNRIIIGAAGAGGIVGIVETAKEQIRAEAKQFKEANLYTEMINEQTKNANLVRERMKYLDERKFTLEKNGQYVGKQKQQMEMEILALRSILSAYTKGKDEIEINIEKGTMKVVIPAAIVRAGIEDYIREQKLKKGLDYVSLGGKHRKDVIEHVSEYAGVKIRSERKIDNMELVLKAEILKDVVRKMSCSSYREGETDRNERYRDPRNNSSLLEKNNITEEKVEQYVQRRVDIDKINKIDKDDISKMAEELFSDIEDKDSLTDEQRKDIIKAIEGELVEEVAKVKVQKELAEITENEHIQEQRREINIKIAEEKKKELEDAIAGIIKDNSQEAGKILKEKLDIILPTSEIQKAMEKLEPKEIVYLIAGKTEIEIPTELFEIAQSSVRLRDLRRELQLSEGRTSPITDNVDNIIRDITRRRNF